MTEHIRGIGALGPRYVEALTLAADIHRDQLRKGSNVPYLAHLLSVSALVLEDGGTEIQAIAALLHDAVEDGGPGVKERVGALGDRVLGMVVECSDDEPVEGVKRPWRVRKEEYVAHLATNSLGALRITGADKLHNARCIVDDARVDGAIPEFNACKHQTLWYYASVSAAVRDRLPERSRIALGLDRIVTELCLVMGEPRPEATPQAPVCDCQNAAA